MNATQIESVESLIVDLPMVRGHVLSVATMRQQSITLVRIRCADGMTGIGEATTIGGLSYGQESPESIKLTIDTYCAPLLLGMALTHPTVLMHRLNAGIVGNHFAKCAIETALLDAFGKHYGLPVSECIGGRVRDRLPVLWTLASGDTAQDAAEAEHMVAIGRHKAFKLKIGKRALADDVTHVHAIKQVLGDKVSVRVDVNMAWDEPTARRGIAMLADVGCDLVEQPIDRQNHAGMARLRAIAPIPLMADESLQGPRDAYDLASRAAADVFSIKIAQSGGLIAAKYVQAVADAAGIAVYGGTMLESAVGTIASAHVFATFPQLPYGTELFGPLLLTEDILSEPLVYRESELILPNTPGLGITLDEDRVSFFRRDRSERHSIHLAPRPGL